MIAILTGVRWNFSVVLIGIYFMVRDVEHFFMCFWAIWFWSFEKVLFSSVAPFVIGPFIWGEFNFGAPCIFWLSVLCLIIASKYILPLCGWSLQFRVHFFCCAEDFNFMKSYLSILCLSCWAARVLLRKLLPIPIASRVFPALFCTNFKVLGLILRSLDSFWVGTSTGC
jgi:hypothetical protein